MPRVGGGCWLTSKWFPPSPRPDRMDFGRDLLQNQEECDEDPREEGTLFRKENLKKWKSLEGDWKTFRDEESKEGLHSDDFDSTSLDERLTPEIVSPCDEYEQEWRSMSPCTNEDRLDTEECRNLSNCENLPDEQRLYRNSIDNLPQIWKHDHMDNFSPFNEERCINSRPHSKHERYSQEDIQNRLHTDNRPEFEDVVNSSYPLLRENFSLLEKLKKERDVCRQLESDMRNLEGQIQNVSKSFEVEVDGKESGNESDAGYSFERNSPHLSNSLEHVYGNDEEAQEEVYEEEENEAREILTDPLLLVENIFSRLLLLADRLESTVRTCEMDFIQIDRNSPVTIHTSPREWEWVERNRELNRIPVELRCMLSQLQTALRQLLVCKDWCRCRELGDRDCSSPASFTFHGYPNSQVIVPTVRAIFTQVGDSIELRPIEEADQSDDCSLGTPEEIVQDTEKAEGSHSSLCSSPRYDSCRNLTSNHHASNSYDDMAQETQEILVEEHPIVDEEEQEESSNNCQQDEASELSSEYLQPEESQDARDRYKPPLMREVHERSFSEIVYPSNYQHSSEIIKRIERLQELVRPELCESLKQRALKIHKAKEEFLSGVSSMPVLNIQPPSQPIVEIIVEEISALPNGLTVKEQVDVPEERRDRIAFPFLRKKRKDWSRDKLSTESLMLDDKSDWLRNPFRPKGKYKISK